MFFSRQMAMRLAVAFNLAVLAAGFTNPAQAIDIREVTSQKGITAWFVEDHTIPLITMRFGFAGGSSADPQDRRGLANFLTAMLDEGAGDLDSNAYQTRQEELAMRMSFDAGRDNFTGSLQTLTNHRDDAFAMLKLALSAPRFDAEPLERMRNQLLIGLEESLEDPQDIAMAAWMKTMFGDHPYANRSSGTLDGIRAISADDLRALTRRLFALDGLMIAVTGDISAETLKRLLDDTFGDLPPTSAMPAIAEAKVASGPAINIIERDIPQSIIRFGHNGIKRDDPDFIPAYVMNYILGGGGFGSRLVEEVREKRGLSYSVFSTLYPLEHAGLIFGGAATVNARAGETVEVLTAQIRRMSRDGPSEKELADAKTYLTGAYGLRFDSSRKTASQLLSIQRAALGIDYVAKRNGLIEAVTLEDVKRVAKRLLDADQLIFTIVGRPEGVTGGAG